METKKTLFGAIASILITVYLFVSVTFVMIYNWNFAKENGFVEWLFLGEIIPTVKGFCWPVFAFDAYEDFQKFVSKTGSSECSVSQHSKTSEPFSDDVLGFGSSSKPKRATCQTYRISQMDQNLAISMMPKSHETAGHLASLTLPASNSALSISVNKGSLDGGGGFSADFDGQKLSGGIQVPGISRTEASHMFWSEIDVYEAGNKNLENIVYSFDIKGAKEMSLPEVNRTYNRFESLARMVDYPVFSENLERFLASLETKKPQEIVVAKVKRVYDGDTFWVDIEGYPAVVGEYIGVRINNIDVPGLTDHRERVKRLALKAKQYTVGRLAEGNKIVLRNARPGKYFNIVADVFVDENNLAQELIGKGLAKSYDRWKRPVW